jgi:anti-sigma B factor antagonist
LSGIGFSISRPGAWDNNKTVVAVSGEIDLTTSDAFEQELARAIDDRAPDGIVVDLSRVTFMDSSALNALVRAFELQRAGLRSMSLVTDDRRVLALFEVTRLDQVIPIFPTRAEALEAAAR